jgi:hypothetical protein
LAPYTPQQNRVAKRKNCTLIEIARTILDEYKTSDQFWAEAINTACHATNHLYLYKLLMRASLPLYHLPLMTLQVVLMFSINPMMTYWTNYKSTCQVIGTIGEFTPN